MYPIASIKKMYMYFDDGVKEFIYNNNSREQLQFNLQQTFYFNNKIYKNRECSILNLKK